MKKVLTVLVALAMVFSLALSVTANGVTNSSNDGTKVTGNGANFDGISIVSDNKAKAWVINNNLADDVIVSVRWQISNVYFADSFEIAAGASFRLGDNNGKNGINNVWFLGFEIIEEDDAGFFAGEPVIVNLGFIGYYLFDGNVLSTSIHWQLLNDGDMIDWDAVDAAYAAWVAQGGLAPERAIWQTSGFASFTFGDYEALGFGDFDIGQLENYYKAYYVCPGYLLPVEEPEYECADFCEGECGLCLNCYDCECDFTGDFSGLPVVNKGCENCQGNNANRRCDGRGCDGTGRGPSGGGNQQ